MPVQRHCLNSTTQPGRREADWGSIEYVTGAGCAEERGHLRAVTRPVTALS